MARANSALVAVLAAAVAIAGYGGARRSDAQTFARLHVRSMTLRVEPQTARVGDVVRLRVTIRLAERVARLNDVTLPELDGFVSLGDERRCVPDGGGTLCAETLSLSPTLAGTRTISPVTLDAIDASNGRPSRFASNAARVDVLPAETPSRLGAVAGALWMLLRIGFLSVLIVGLVLGIWAMRRRRPDPSPGPVLANDGAVEGADDVAEWRSLVANLRAQPSRAHALAVRHALRERLGAHEADTLGDLAARGAGAEAPGTIEALALIERAAFDDDAHVAAAVVSALTALEQLAPPHHLRLTENSAPNRRREPGTKAAR